MLSIDALRNPAIRLNGVVNDEMATGFSAQLTTAQDGPGPIVVELTTLGGEAEAARRIAQDIRLSIQHFSADVYFVGKTVVYSAGVTIMGAFPLERRFLTQDASLLIHERRMDKTLSLSGPLRVCEANLLDALAELKMSQQIQADDFAQLIQGSEINSAELENHLANSNWYLNANEALNYKLICGVF
jgi:ATP-dependent Clp protease protease subunit